MEKAQIGLIGLAVMGENLVLNIERNGFRVAVFNRTTEKTKKFGEGKAKGKQIIPCYSMEEFAASLEVPRKVIVMVKAGEAVDSMISALSCTWGRGISSLMGGTAISRTRSGAANS